MMRDVEAITLATVNNRLAYLEGRVEELSSFTHSHRHLIDDKLKRWCGLPVTAGADDTFRTLKAENERLRAQLDAIRTALTDA